MSITVFDAAILATLKRRVAYRKLLIGLCVSVVLLCGGKAQAQQGQWSSSSCSLTSSSLNLGSYEPDSHQDTTQEIGFRCTTTFPYNASETSATFRLCLYMGEDSGVKPGYDPWRYMSNSSSEYLAYNLYADSSRTQILVPEGMGSPVVSELTVNQGYPYQPVSSTGKFIVHARIPAAQLGLSAGNYRSLNPSFRLFYSMSAGNVAPSDCTQGNAYGGGYWGGNPIQLNAHVAESCLLSTQELNFGVIDQVGLVHTAVNAVGQLIVNCSTGTAYSVYLGQGNYATGALRQMANANSRLPYQLFQDNAHTAVWTESSGVSRTATGNEQIIPVYGQIPLGTVVPSELGLYTDTVIVTVSY